MNVSYRFFAELSAIRQAGFDLPNDGSVFIIQGNDERLDKVKQILGSEWRNYCFAEMEFTEEERSSAPYLSIRASKNLGYLQPEDRYEEVEEEGLAEYPYPFDVYPYFKDVYELAGKSDTFGMLRGKQIGSFKLQGEPRWGKAMIGSTFQAGDVFFTTFEVYNTIFKPLGIACREVLAYGNLAPLKTIVQIIPQGISKSKLIINEEYLLEKFFIKEWNLTKYVLSGDNVPLFEARPSGYDFFISQEYFGDGGVNENEVFISQKLYQILKKNKIKGLNYIPFNVKEEKEIAKKHQEEKRKNARPGTTWSLLDD
ncbi:hypothetical protein ACI76W_03925 [Capnocytophaga canimorsus]|uniref:hypothetical protein n=1 Tax=Capnocytophaga canimorsus TaxID=28188 RepID=UPI00385A0889